ncbi:unnamed protein product [Rangifer tarandus platyrhynchus]|uniref:Uncharacterized protein n=1 Tax=Rangifer tarandus platyrhynchus TaxID=3082113 RepID=A0ABN8YA91_RANTA|nr:unnamed protein product [Rangifer tarandus platyrhynchus]
MCLVTLGCLLDTRHMRVLTSSGPALVPAAPQNSSGGVSVASLQWLSERAPSLVTVWTLVALWSVLGERVCWAGSAPARGAGLPECVEVLPVVLGFLCRVGIAGQHCFREQQVGPQGHLAPPPGAVGLGLSRRDVGRCSVARALGAHAALPKPRHDGTAPDGAGGAQAREAPTVGWQLNGTLGQRDGTRTAELGAGPRNRDTACCVWREPGRGPRAELFAESSRTHSCGHPGCPASWPSDHHQVQFAAFLSPQLTSAQPGPARDGLSHWHPRCLALSSAQPSSGSGGTERSEGPRDWEAKEQPLDGLGGRRVPGLGPASCADMCERPTPHGPLPAAVLRPLGESLGMPQAQCVPA